MPTPAIARLLLLLFLSTSVLSIDHLHLSSSAGPAARPQEYMDPTYPSTLLPSSPPSASLLLLSHSFANTYGQPPAAAAYAPPAACPPPWARVVLDFSASSTGDQYDRVAAVWLSGAEILRTTTPEPNPNGVFWRVQRDVSHLAALLRRPAELTVMLENIVDSSLTGVYHVNVSLYFYYIAPSLSVSRALKLPPLYPDAADLIVPVSKGSGRLNGYWFRIANASDERSTSVAVPRNAYRAVLEVFASPHGDDEFWYSNPPDAYIAANNLTTRRGNGAYREILVDIDGRFAGSVVPFPTIYTGGINPLFWQPVVGIGAFDIRPYELDLTPFLGILVDGQQHQIGLSVADSISFWLVDANLHLWLDESMPAVTAALVRYHLPAMSLSRKNSWQGLNGTFKIKVERTSRFAGWVSSSRGNLTTKANRKIKYKSHLRIIDDGKEKNVTVKTSRHLNVKISMPGHHGDAMVAYRTYETKYPLRIWTRETAPDAGGESYIARTNISHSLREEFDDEISGASSTLQDDQEGGGWMLVNGHSVLNGSAGTRQTYRYAGGEGQYKRRIVVQDGIILSDSNSTERAGAGIAAL